jgi:bacteriocin-like protein
MNTQMTVISQEELKQISGGHATELGIMFVLSIPHVIMGLIEFTNYVGDKYANGWLTDENDYFAHIIASPVTFWNYLTND